MAEPVARGLAAPQPVAAEPLAVDPLAPLADDLAALRTDQSGLVIDCRAFGTDVLSTTTALPLARLLASLGRAVIVDCSGASPDLDKAIGQTRPPGLSDMLVDAVSFGDIIHRDRHSRMHVISFGTQTGMPVDASAPAFVELVDALMHTYDFVVLDVGIAPGPLGRAAHLAKAIVMVSSRDDSDPVVRAAFDKLNALRPGCVTIVVEEPMLATPTAANDRPGRATTAA